MEPLDSKSRNSFARWCMEEGVDLPDCFEARSVEVAKLPGKYKVAWSKIRGPEGGEED